MDTNILFLIFAAAGLLAGFLLGSVLRKNKSQQLLEKATTEAGEIISNAKIEAESIKKEKMLQAKERFIELKSEHEKDIFSREKKISEVEKRLNDKESRLSHELKRNGELNRKLEQQNNLLTNKMNNIDRKTEEIESKLQIQINKLEEISGFSAADAKEELIASLKEKAKSEAMAFIQQNIEEAKLTVQQEAQKIIINTIQRIGTEEAVENCVSVFNLESDDVKGRIIGREGRNIRALEAETGVEIIVDDTPEAIILSCFDPVRREIARLSLHRLVSDGRIHPARIEEVVNKTRKQIDNEIIEVGKRTVIDLGIHGLHPELVRVVGPNEISLFLWTKLIATLP